MKIVLAASYLASKGGVARYVWEFAEFLASKGDDVILLSLYTDKSIYYSKENIKIIDLADTNCLPQSIIFWLNLKKIKQKFSFLIQKEKPDVVLFNDFPATLWAQKFGKMPVLCYTHDIHMLYTNTYIINLPFLTRFLWRILRLIIRFYDKKAWKSFDQVLCNSKFMKEYILKTYKTETDVMYPGTNTNFFTMGSTSKKKVILTLGDIKLRRADFLINAAIRLAKKRNDFKIWVVGNKGSYDEELQKLVKKHKLDEIVEFFGKVSDSKLADLYSKSLVVVHLVKEAPFGLIVTEAMAFGTPVISWKPGPEEIVVHNKTGFLIKENDYDDLIKYLEKFLDNPQLSTTMGKDARKRVQNHFEMSKNNNKLRNLMIEWIDKKLQVA